MQHGIGSHTRRSGRQGQASCGAAFCHKCGLLGTCSCQACCHPLPRQAQPSSVALAVGPGGDDGSCGAQLAGAAGG
jgi:hypothetical protein